MSVSAVKRNKGGVDRDGSALVPQDWRAEPEAGQRPPIPGSVAARLAVAGVLLALGYEWLLSGLNKLLSADFRPGLAANLQDATKDNPNRWYVSLLTRLVLPHARAFATLVTAGELLVAAGLTAGAVWWLAGARLPRGWARLLHAGVLAALVGSALMTANYYPIAGNRLPWMDPSHPFNEGLDIDGLLTLVALALLCVHVVAWLARTGRAGSGARRTSDAAGDRAPEPAAAD